MVLPETAREDLVNQVLGVVRLHLQLFQDDALLLLDVLVMEQRMQHQVRKDVEDQRQVLVQHLGVEADHLLGREGVQVASDGVHRAGDVLRRAAGGPLEYHVLDEVRDAVLFGRLLAASGAHPDA